MIRQWLNGMEARGRAQNHTPCVSPSTREVYCVGCIRLGLGGSRVHRGSEPLTLREPTRVDKPVAGSLKIIHNLRRCHSTPKLQISIGRMQAGE